MYIVEFIDRVFGFIGRKAYDDFEEARNKAEESALELGENWAVLMYNKENPLDYIEF